MGIRTCMVIVGVVGLVGLARAESPPEINDAVKQAAAARKPLLLEFHAEWCMPCKEFAATTLPDPRVQAALKKVVFVRYDAADKEADEAAVKYNVHAYPTFVIVDRRGIERDRFEGAPLGESGVATFIELIGRARFAGLEVDEIVAEVKARPKDTALRLAAANWFAEHDQVKAALTQYDALSAYKDATSAERTAAVAAAVRIRRIEQWKQQLLAEKRALVRAGPRDVDRDDVLLVMLTPKLSANEADKAMAPILEAQTDLSRLNSFVYVALAAGAKQQALVAAKRLVKQQRDAQYLDTLAECHYSVGDRKQAVALADEALTLAKGDADLERTLRYNRRRFDTGKREEDGVRQARARVKDLWERLAKIDRLAAHVHDHDHDAASMDMRKSWRQSTNARESRNALVKTIVKTCSGKAGTVKQAAVRLEMVRDGRINNTVLLLEPATTPALRDCINAQVAAAKLTTDPSDYSPTIMINFE